MPRALKGSNDLAKAVGALTLAARAEEDSKANALGLGAAKAKKEEELRKAEDQRRRERKEAQRQLDLETAAATAATTQEAAQLHAGLQGIRGTAFESRVQRTVDSSVTKRLVLAVTTEMRTIRQFREEDVQNAIITVLANLAMANTHASMMLAKLRTGTYCDLHPPLNQNARIKIEYEGQGAELTSEMVTKLFQEEGCTTVEMWQLGKDGRCDPPKFRSASGMPPVRYFSPAYIATVVEITPAFSKQVDSEGKIKLPHGTFTLAPLPPTEEFMVQMVMSAGTSDDLSGNMWAMTAMGLSQIEIERCLGRIMTQALHSSNISADVISKFIGVFISSEVRRQEGQGGRAFLQHARDPLLKPHPRNAMVMTTPAAVGSTDLGQGSPKMFLIMSSVPAAIEVRYKLQEVQLQLPIGQGIKMTPVPVAPLMETGLPATQRKLQEQENAARKEAFDWVQEAQSCLTACEAAPGNMLVVSRLATKMEEGKGLMTRAHPEVSKQMQDIFRHYDRGSENASEPDDWWRLCQEITSSLVEIEKGIGLLEMRVAHATITLPPGTTMKQLFAQYTTNPTAKMPALMVNIQIALKIHPVGMQWCVVRGSGGIKLQGVKGEAPLFYLSIWEPHAEGLRDNLHFNGNKAIFNFMSLEGKEIKAHIKLLADKESDGKSPVTPAQEMGKMLEAFNRGIAIFVPTTTKTGEAIRANTALSDLQPLSEAEKKERPCDIRVWNLEDGVSEGRLQALQVLIRENQVSLVVSANEDQQDWTVYMARSYAMAINDCAGRKLFSWDEVQQGEDIRDRVAEVLQITFMELLSEHALGGIYCSEDMAPDNDQGAEMSIDGPMIHDLAIMPRSINALGNKHPFVNTDQGTMARGVLARLVGLGSILIIRKGGVGIIITEPLRGLVNTIRQCAASTMSQAIMTKWSEIPMPESDLEQLTKVVEKHLWRTNFLWLFAGPGQLGAPPILALEMQDQARECEALTVCKLDKQDARLFAGNWIFQAIHILVTRGTVVAQKVGNRGTKRTGYMIISPEENTTFLDQYGDITMAVNRLKSTKLGDDDQARAQLLQLELDTLENFLDRASDNIILVTGAERTEEGFTFTEGQFSGDPTADIDVLTHGLARKSGEHAQTTIYHVLNQGKRVLGIPSGVLLVPPGHDLATWDQNDARLSKWHPSKPLAELLLAAREMDLDPLRSEKQWSEWDPSMNWPQDQMAASPNSKRPAADMASAGEQVRQVIDREKALIQYLRPAGADASSCMNRERFPATNVNNWSQSDEWVTQVDAQGNITLMIKFEQKVCALGMSLGHGTQGRNFTCVKVSESNEDQKCNQIDLPQATEEARDFSTWFQIPIEGHEIVLTFNMHSVIGDKGAPGLAYVALVGYMVESEDDGTGQRKKKNRK
jgi:hypothetical protein